MEKLTNRKLIQSVKSLVADRTGKPTDYNQYSNRLILFYLQMFRSRIIFEKRHQRHELDHRFNRQTINCVYLYEIDQSESEIAPHSGYRILKSEYPLPRPVFGKFDAVSSVIANINYDFVRWDRFKNVTKSRIRAQKTQPYYTLKDIGNGVFLYLYNDLQKEEVNVSSVFENPVEAQFYPGCKDKPYCNPLDEIFVLDQELVTIVVELTADKMAKLKSYSHPDILTNDMDNTATPPLTQRRNNE